MRSFARFNPAMKPGRHVRITLKGVVTSVNKNASVMRVKTDCPGDELAFSAADDIKVEFDFQSEGVVQPGDVVRILNEADEAVEAIEARNGLVHRNYYMDSAGKVFEYSKENGDRPFRPFQYPWSSAVDVNLPKRPLRKVTVGDAITSDPGYEVGAIYETEDHARFLRKPGGWTYLAPTGYIHHDFRPHGPLRKIAAA